MADTLQKRKYIYDAKGLLVEISDKNNNLTKIEYQDDLIYKVETPSNHIIHFTCSDGRITQIEDELGRRIIYKYTSGQLTEVIDTECGSTRYEYNPQGYISSATDQNDNTYIKNKYDDQGRVTYQEYANGETCTISYDDESRQTMFEYSPQKRTQIYRYNEDYLVTQVVYEDGSFEEYGYDKYQNKSSIQDRNENITLRQYDIYGNILREELPNGLVTEFKYDESLNLIERSDNNGGHSRYAYDTNSNIITHERKATADNWQTTRNEYDAYGRIIKTADSMGNSRSFTYVDGDKLLPYPNTIEDSENNVFGYRYDILGRTTALITSYGQVEYTLDGKNQITKIKDALGNVTKKVYDKVGNLVRLITAGNYDPKNDSTDAYEYSYDPMDELVAVTDPLGNVTKSIKDTRGNILKEINPRYYDPKTDNGIGIEYVYDHDNRRIKTIYPDGGVERFFYDSNGNLIRHITPEYYNPDTDDGVGLSYSYNSMNQLMQISNANGEIEKAFQYDLYGRVTYETAADGSTALYKYDLAGNLIEKRVPVEKNIDKTLDKSEEKILFRLIRYEYDLNGNKIKELHAKQTVGEADLPNTCLSDPWHEISFTYDRNNRLIKVSDKSGAQAEYQYNCLNLKTYESIRINTDTTRITQYKYNELGEVAEKGPLPQWL
jgi:YD repeat-containing protein